MFEICTRAGLLNILNASGLRYNANMTYQDPFPKPDTRWFTELRFGMFIHWGLYALAARHEWVKSREERDDAYYRKYFENFNPDLYDPADWAREARRAGMKYVVITTRHHDGFSLWDTAHSDYKSTNTPCGRDLIAPFVEAFRAEGLRVGFYYSLLDWHHPHYTVDRRHPQRNSEEARRHDAGKQPALYAEFMRNQVRELLEQHRPDIIWYDFSFPGEDGKGREYWESEKLYALTREICPDILINNRLDLEGVGDFVTPEQFQPVSQPLDDKGNPLVWEACQTFSGSWGYYRDEQTWKSTDMLLRMLIDGVSMNGNLLLNVGPTARGNFDDRALDRLRGMGRWMDLNGKSIYGCGSAPAEFKPPRDCRYTWNPETRRLYLHVFAWPFRHIHLPGLKDKVRYAQFLHDGSEILFHEQGAGPVSPASGEKDLILMIPIPKPDVEIPVIELVLE